MDNNKFQEILKQIKSGKYPPVLGNVISAEQYIQIQNACGYLLNEVKPNDFEKIKGISNYLVSWRSKIGPDFMKEAEVLHNATRPFSQRIKEFIAEHGPEGDTVLLVHGDHQNHQAHFNIFGHPQETAMAFAALLDNENSDFKRFIFSLLGVYLAKNPEDLKQFMQGIEVAKQTPGVN